MNTSLLATMRGTRRALTAMVGLLALETCAVFPQSGTPPSKAATLPVFVGVTNESAITRRFQLRVDNVVAIDTVVGRPLDLTGRVLATTVQLAPGRHELVLIDSHRNQQFGAQLTVRAGEMCIFVSFLTPRTDFRAGNYVCLFA